jgi:hypothetical protein
MRYDRPRDAAGIDELADAEAGFRGVIGVTVRLRACRATSASTSRSGVPTPRKPPIMTLAPSGTSRAASSALIAERMLTVVLSCHPEPCPRPR